MSGTQKHRMIHVAPKRAQKPERLPVLLMLSAAACSTRISSVQKLEKGNWTQEDLAAKLQLAGWDIDRSQLSKIECRLVHLSDYEQMFFARVFNIKIDDLFPSVDSKERLDDYLGKTMARKNLPIPRGGKEKPEEPFIWTASASDILEKVKRGRKKLHNMQSA